MTFKTTGKDFHFQPYGTVDILKKPPATNHLTEHKRTKTLCHYISTMIGNENRKERRQEEKEWKREREREAKDEERTTNVIVAKFLIHLILILVFEDVPI